VSFGSDLQKLRKKSGVSLEAIAATTKVPSRHLRALEQEHWAELPGGIFIRGIVRSYCNVLGLNETEWLGKLAACSPAASVAEEDWLEFAENVKRSRITTQPALRRRWWGVALMLVALGGLSWAAWHYVVQPRVQPGPMPSLRALLFTPKH
jgi:cytoskeleton protein RodZ